MKIAGIVGGVGFAPSTSISLSLLALDALSTSFSSREPWFASNSFWILARCSSYLALSFSNTSPRSTNGSFSSAFVRESASETLSPRSEV